jgi:hypothetical protein
LENPREFLFLRDYAERRRIKVWGTSRVVEGDAGLNETLRDPSYPGEMQRAVLFSVEAWAAFQAATSASTAWASSRLAPSRRISLSTSWPVGNGTIRRSIVDSLMAGYSSASWAIGELRQPRRWWILR